MTNLSIIERLSKQTDELIVPKKKPPYINYYYRNNNPGMVIVEKNIISIIVNQRV